ncbi:hypothetical protein MRB53_007051 [Persea americana]|uniref:Uncharacterized protein n=1 Tax=Persea americana TaxID=3435 RepID=A0ACC2MIE4_PERAE|nr:hypothetical protein MRB53_007051 [Persea americana]
MDFHRDIATSTMLLSTTAIIIAIIIVITVLLIYLIFAITCIGILGDAFVGTTGAIFREWKNAKDLLQIVLVDVFSNWICL